MAQENCAPSGAPRGSFIQAPSGFRRMTPGLLKADRTAEGFAGLPERVSSPGQLLAALKAEGAWIKLPRGAPDGAQFSCAIVILLLGWIATGKPTPLTETAISVLTGTASFS